MNDKKEIIPLKLERSKLMTRITSLSRPLSTSNSNDLEFFQQLYKQLHEAYSEFNDIQTLYCELVEADDKYAEYRVFSSLDLKVYYDVVRQNYNEAVTTFNRFMLKPVEYDIALACTTAKQMLHESSDCDILNEHIILRKELSRKYFDIAGQTHVDLRNVILELQSSFRARINISHLSVSRNSSPMVLSDTNNGHAVQDWLGRGGVRDVAGVSFGGALQPGQTLTDDNLNKYPVSKDEQEDYSYLANNCASKLQSSRYAILFWDPTSKRLSIVSAYAGYELSPINLSLSKSQHESNEPVNGEHACNSKFKKYPPT